MVASKINKAVLFPESKTIDPEDIGHSSAIYELDVYPGETITVALGYPKYTFTEKNVIFLPIYAISGKKVRSQIGVFEIESNKLINAFKGGEIDISRLNPPILFSFVNEKYIQRLDAYATHYVVPLLSLAKPSVEIESQPDTSDPTFKLRVPTSQISQEKRDAAATLENGVFVIDKDVSPPAALVEETEVTANKLTEEYRESAKNNWMEKRMKNNNYRIREIVGDGDCYFTSIKNAFAEIGRKTTVDKLRAILSNEITDELFQDLRTFYLHYETIIKRIQSKKRGIQKRIADIKKQVDNIEVPRETKIELIEKAKAEKAVHDELNIELKSVEKSRDDEIGYMKTLDTIDKYRAYVRTQSFWADEWAISTLERILNFKTIIFSEYAYENGAMDDVLKCGIVSKEIETRGSFTPDYYIIVSHTGNHYNLITYREKSIFKFTEIPYHVKMLILNKCLEKNAGPYYLIQDFRNYKSRFGIDEDEGRPHDYADEDGNGDLYDDKTKFMIYHTAPNEKIKPGKVDGEVLPKSRSVEFIPLSKIPEWRKKLDDDWMGASMKIRDKTWSSITHYLEGSKYRMGHPDIYSQFSIESGNPTAKDIKLAKSHKNIQLAEQSGKMVKKRSVKPDVDYALGRNVEERDMALRVKFKDNVDLQAVLLATKNALLLRKETFGQPAEPDNQLMRIRKELQME